MTSGSLPVAAFEQPPLVLTFAASDPTSGAGLQADLLTIASLGCHGTSVLTGITVQDSAGVDEVMALDADWVDDQARTLLEDMSVSAFKLGVLCSAENVRVIAEIMSDYPDIPLVFDPVLASGRGDSLSDEEVIEAMRELLLPQTTIVTPNSLEARRLAATDQDEELESLTLDVCAQRLLQIGAEYVLITGTHEVSTSVTNRLFNAAGLVRADEWQRLPGSLPWLGLHFGISHCCHAGAGSRFARCGTAGSGIYLEHISACFSSWYGASDTRPIFLVAPNGTE